MHANKKTIMITKNSLLTRSTLLTLALAVLPALLAQPVRAQSSESPESGFRAFVGFKTLNLGDQRFWHDTHPDDSFLPESNVPGSAGVTNIGGTRTYITAGAGYQKRLSDLFSLTLDVGILLSNHNRNRHQNANDGRPAATGAFVYSQSKTGLCASAGLSCHMGNFHIGIESQYAGVFIDHGWDRFSSDESQHSYFEHFISAGPRIGWTFFEDATGYDIVEGTVQFNHGASFEIKIVLMF
jgi:hypothetical protein